MKLARLTTNHVVKHLSLLLTLFDVGLEWRLPGLLHRLLLPFGMPLVDHLALAVFLLYSGPFISMISGVRVARNLAVMVGEVAPFRLRSYLERLPTIV